MCCCRYGMFAPGCVALAVSVLVLIFFKDTPESLGFPAIDANTKKPVAKDTPEPAGGFPALPCINELGVYCVLYYQCGDTEGAERIVACAACSGSGISVMASPSTLQGSLGLSHVART